MGVDAHGEQVGGGAAPELEAVTGSGYADKWYDIGSQRFVDGGSSV
jgi:hypothetical protein